MSKKPLIKLLTSDVLPLGAVKLGRLIVDREQPWQDYCSYSLVTPTEDEMIPGPLDNVRNTSEQESSWDIIGAVGSFFSAMINHQKNKTGKLDTEQAVVWRLDNSPNFLERLCKAKFVKDWLERKIGTEERSVYLVTGLITFKDATINQDASSSTGAELEGRAPVTALVTHGASETLPPQQGQAVDPKAKVKAKTRNKTTISLDAPGVRIIAVEYTKVRRRGHSSAEIKDSDIFLKAKSSRWKYSFRGTGGKDHDIMEVYIGPPDKGSEEELEEIDQADYGEEDEEEAIDDDEQDGDDHGVEKKETETK